MGVPGPDVLGLVERKAIETNITVAIHNYGPGDLLYSSPNDDYAAVKNLDRRIGLCMDIGHAVRINQDPTALAEKYGDRLYDIHFKDLTAPTESIGFVRGILAAL